MSDAVVERMAQATAVRIAALRATGAELDEWSVALATSLAELMDSEPTAAVAKELRAVLADLSPRGADGKSRQAAITEAITGPSPVGNAKKSRKANTRT